MKGGCTGFDGLSTDKSAPQPADPKFQPNDTQPKERPPQVSGPDVPMDKSSGLGGKNGPETDLNKADDRFKSANGPGMTRKHEKEPTVFY